MATGKRIISFLMILFFAFLMWLLLNADFFTETQRRDSAQKLREEDQRGRSVQRLSDLA